MNKPLSDNKQLWPGFHGPNLGYVAELYEKFLEDPESVDEEMREYFNKYRGQTDTIMAQEEGNEPQNIKKLVSAIQLADNIRSYGHITAKIHPFTGDNTNNEWLQFDKYGISKEDLSRISADLLCPDAPENIRTGYDAIEHLKKVYTGTIAFEFQHVHDVNEKNWLRKKVESGSLLSKLNQQESKNLLKRLIEVDEFEKYLHKTFVGQKRFSIEGLDTMIPLLDKAISEAVRKGTGTINIGMAHRGRLNVLAHVLGKPYETIFAEFQYSPNKELVPSEGSIGINYGWTGDVKYHLGLDRQIKAESTRKARLTLANNPSHLEFVGAIVEGFTRAGQDDRSKSGFPEYNPSSALAVLIHGDAAFPGQGIVSETLNLSSLNGYKTGGILHIIANNMIGFTTESYDSRSTRYASDPAKGYEVPIVHVNADDPEACIAVARLAIEYRQTFHKDFLIDLIGYRRYGHNEMDEPMSTNPSIYRKINAHDRVKELYGKKLIEEGYLKEQDLEEMEKEIMDRLQAAYETVPEKRKRDIMEMNPPDIVEKGLPQIETSVPINTLKTINEQLLTWPTDFNVFNKLERILKRRSDAFSEGGKIDWALAETLAFATIISEGTPIRLTGQDAERATFAHRNLILHDMDSERVFSPLHQIPTGNASFAIHNSPLSEASVVGFEYGYNVFAPETLVIWEAQYGDFANVAQVIFDQFIAAGRAKWGQKSGLVLLLPHGYEGQGPEHSSARPERFLTLAAENNWTVANLTTAAQYFHILRRQAAILQREGVRPLVLMTPKSLLRNPFVSSEGRDLAEGKFMSILEQPGLETDPQKIERVLVCSGKIGVDIAENFDENAHDWIHVLRIEELYPFPLESLKNKLKELPNLKEICWVQEEPKNMGAWTFVEPRINEAAPSGIRVSYIGRRRRSSPAEGDPNVHKQKQTRIIEEALKKKEVL